LYYSWHWGLFPYILLLISHMLHLSCFDCVTLRFYTPQTRFSTVNLNEIFHTFTMPASMVILICHFARATLFVSRLKSKVLICGFYCAVHLYR
jgi:hypothetical protein